MKVKLSSVKLDALVKILCSVQVLVWNKKITCKAVWRHRLIRVPWGVRQRQGITGDINGPIEILDPFELPVPSEEIICKTLKQRRLSVLVGSVPIHSVHG